MPLDSSAPVLWQRKFASRRPIWEWAASLNRFFPPSRLKPLHERFFQRSITGALVWCSSNGTAKTANYTCSRLTPIRQSWTGLPAACGVDLPWYYYALCADLPLKVKTEYEAGVRWINAERNFFTARTYIRNGQLTWWRWLRDVVTTRHSAYFSWTDPLPGLYSCYRVISRVLGALRKGNFRGSGRTVWRWRINPRVAHDTLSRQFIRILRRGFGPAKVAATGVTVSTGEVRPGLS